MATKKADGKKRTKPVLRGVELVEAVMAKRVVDGETLAGYPSNELDKLGLGHKPLSPSLRRWLELDADTFKLGEPQSLLELVRRDFGDTWASMYEGIAPLLPEAIVPFEGWGSDSRRFLYLGKADAFGEYTVMTLDTDDAPFLCVNGPVDVWLAQGAGFLEEEHEYGSVPKEYEPMRKEHAKLNFDGYIVWMDGMLGMLGKKLDPYDDF